MNLFLEFHDKGLAVIPLKDGRPIIEAWAPFFERLPGKEEIAAFPNSKEYGLICGAASNVIGIDIDTDDTTRIEQLAGISPVKKYGSKGFTAFYKYEGQISQNWKNSKGEVICELLSTKRLTTIPPSPHRKTKKPYEWHNGVALGSVELPSLNADFITLMDALYPKPVHHFKLPNYYGQQESVDLSEAKKMLDFISPDCARDEWIQIGMALRDEFGDAACNLWHDWSQSSPKYDLRAAQSAWRSFSGSGVTIGTIIHHATQSGYTRPQTYTPPSEGFDVDLSYILPRQKSPVVEEIKVGGLVGKIADWITSTAIIPQPVLSLAASIVFVSLLKGHRVRGRTNVRTNVMALSMAPTAGGKDHPQRSIDRLADAIGMGNHVMGEPTSGTALLTGIHKANGIGMLVVDEIGRYMSNFNMKNAMGHQKEIGDYFVKLYSAASGTFRGKQYAKEKENPQVILQQPYFCCLGSTVQEKLKAACTSSEVIDGFLNRWLVFNAPTRPEKQRGVKIAPPPEELIEAINKWLEDFPLKKDNYGSPEPVEMVFTPEAWDVFLAFEKTMLELMENTPHPLNELYVRSGEYVEKLAMILSDERNIGTSEVNNAIKIVTQSNKQILAFADTITDTQHEADLLYLLNIIKKYPKGISRENLTQRSRKLTNKQRADIVNQLVDSGEVKTNQSTGSKKITYQFTGSSQ